MNVRASTCSISNDRRPKGVRAAAHRSRDRQTNSLVQIVMALRFTPTASIFAGTALPLRRLLVDDGAQDRRHRCHHRSSIRRRAAAIEKYKITCGQYAPTHFIRLKRLGGSFEIRSVLP